MIRLAAIAGLVGLTLTAGCGPSREERLAALRAGLELPSRHHPLHPEVREQWRERGLVFERLRFAGRRGDPVAGLLCYSRLASFRPAPALLCMPGSPNVKEDLLRPLDLIPRWAEAGYVVLSLDRPYQGERGGDLIAAIRRRGLLAVWGESVHDLLNGVEYLTTRPEVDAGRIGMLGLSMGGLESLWVAALDPRIKVVVSVSGQLAWTPVFAAERWPVVFRGLPLRDELVTRGATGAGAQPLILAALPGLRGVDAAQVAPCLGPRPLLLMLGEEDPIVPVAAAEAVRQAAAVAYQGPDESARLELWVEPGAGHAFTRAMQERALGWFRRWL